MNVNEAGRVGGLKVKEKYGEDYFKELGRKGGKARAAKHPEKIKEFGSIGGKKVFKKYGVGHFKMIRQKKEQYNAEVVS